jgi:small subunit ribosomal protein S4e
MVKRHLSRLAAPNTWPIARKLVKFVMRPKPGAHSFETGIPVGIILKELLNGTKTTKETRYILSTKDISIDGKKVKDRHTQVGLMDVLSLPVLKKNYRILISKRKKVYLKDVDDKEAKFKLCKIVGKKMLSGKKMQLNLHDAKNALYDKECSAGDTVVFEFGKGIVETIPLKEGCTVYLTDGSHVGIHGTVVKFICTKRRRDEIIINSDNTEVRTLKKYAFVVGDTKPRISLD